MRTKSLEVNGSTLRLMCVNKKQNKEGQISGFGVNIY